MTIILITLTIGMLLFQLLVTLEAFRNLKKQLIRDLNVQWFALPKMEQPWMRSTPGVMTLSPKAQAKAWLKIIK
jgi:hypothetical protein